MFEKLSSAFRLIWHANRLKKLLKSENSSIVVIDEYNFMMLSILKNNSIWEKNDSIQSLKKDVLQFIDKVNDSIEKLKANITEEANFLKILADNLFIDENLVKEFKKNNIDLNALINKKYEIDPKLIALVNTELLLLIEKLNKNLIEQKVLILKIENSTSHDDICNKLNEQKEILVEIKDKLKRLSKLSEAELKKYQLSRRKFLQYGATTGISTLCDVGIGTGICGATLVLIDTYLRHEVSKLPERHNDGLAIFISNPNGWLDKLSDTVFNSIYISRIQLAFGFKAKYIEIAPSYERVREITLKDEIQNICIAGHGDRVSWNLDKDTIMDNYSMFSRYTSQEFQKLRESFEKELKPEYDSKEDLEEAVDKKLKPFCRLVKKKGYFLKHTCGEDPSKGEYDKEVGRIYHENKNDEEYADFETANYTLLGVPSFKKDHVAHLDRIAINYEFLINPLRSVNMEDKFKNKIEKIG